MSYFEVLTVAFFIYAGQVDVDLLIIEVGIGGEKDYTNILPHAVRVITSIGKDHIPSLGEDEFAITKQKAGIMHHGDTLVVGEIAPEYLAIIQDKVTQEEGQLISYKLQPQMDIPQLGFYQVWNARTAYAAFAAFTKGNGLYFNKQTAIEAIQATALPGRMELIANKPATFIDGAHNISAIKVLLKELKATFADTRIIMYFSSLDRNEINDSLDYIQAHSDVELYVTTFDYEEARKEEVYLATTDAKFVNNWYDDYKQSA
ncbi:glutamate ligase domain-containing protein, partial [Aerococcus sp. L_32]|uniref:glutamate ligase domain-containing protein n=1 Tax=Aerococcus sp. L_32 TaxID=3422316 RepID=UPI003D6B1A3E